MGEIKLNARQFIDLAEEVLAQENSLSFRVKGVSMRPFILEGDALEIQAVQPERIRLGDVVLYRAGTERLLAHRVVGFRKESGESFFLLQGDAARQRDGWVAGHQVLGRAISLNRNNHRVQLNTPVIQFISFCLVLFLPVYKRIMGILNNH
jgi:signal peptidase I